MANMSYCRFRNTAPDLRDCAENIGDEDMSLDERQARRWLIKICREIVADADYNTDWEEAQS